MLYKNTHLFFLQHIHIYIYIYNAVIYITLFSVCHIILKNWKGGHWLWGVEPLVVEGAELLDCRRGLREGS